jgi:type II secretory pathway pseudopilin PulG
MIEIKNNLKKTKTGFSLIEIIVSISLFMIFVVAVLNTINYSFKQIVHSANINQANILAEETLEIVKNIRDNNFSNLVNGGFGLSASTGKWILIEAADTVGIFERNIEISDFNDDQKLIIVTINWSDNVSADNTFTARTYLTNWRTESEPEI